ncbi:FadR/GntR family transcriptional regulator [Microbacterium rhizomatis]|uniref:FadR/GntR family transcriptional regulator n=1 Tax=Microbacterium rhizomatis TaxID=1631477 RepID=UPI0014796E54|nr:FCD domain-containing protein [Microbacterium rhizomatis]
MTSDTRASTRRGRPRKPMILAETIADGIVDAGMRPGERLPAEAEMALKYSAGRASVRESLRILEAEGIVETRVGAGGGAFVAHPRRESIARPLSVLMRMSDIGLREVLEARLLIEPSLAAAAASHCTPAQAALLESANDALGRLEEGGEDWRRMNREYHTLIAEIAANRPLAMMWDILSMIADGHDAGVRYPAHSLHEADAAHRKILRAIVAGDGEGAARAMRIHLEAMAEHVARSYPQLLDGPIAIVRSQS